MTEASEPPAQPEPPAPSAQRIPYAAIAGALFVLATVLSLLDADATMDVADYVASGCIFAGAGTLAIGVALRRQLRAAAGEHGAVSVVRAVVAAVAWLAVIAAVERAASNDVPVADTVALGVLLYLIVQCVLAIAIARRHLEAAHRSKEHSLAARAAAQQAHLEALRRQLDPHFLFNCLTTISSLVREDPAAAESAIARLSRVLRHSLTTDDEAGTVAQEIDVCRAMVALACARFESALEVSERYDDTDVLLAAQPLPPFLVQPLLENAFEHGMRTARAPVRVELAVSRVDGGIAFDVINDGRLDAVRGPGKTPSIGLDNLRGRLQLLYPGRHELTVEQRGDRVHARLRLTTHA